MNLTQTTTTSRTTSRRTTVAEDLATLKDAKAANPKAKSLAGALTGNLTSGSKQKPGAANKAHAASVAAAAAKGKEKPKAGSLQAKRDALKAKAAAAPKKPVDLTKEKREAAKAKDSADRQAAYKAKIETQKQETAARHHAQKLMASFIARATYMAYMDNPAFGGLDGKESIGWTIKHVNSHGVAYAVERVGSADTCTLTVHAKGQKAVVTSCPCTKEDVAAAIKDWEA